LANVMPGNEVAAVLRDGYEDKPQSPDGSDTQQEEDASDHAASLEHPRLDLTPLRAP